jgi:hypothetical protein
MSDRTEIHAARSNVPNATRDMFPVVSAIIEKRGIGLGASKHLAVGSSGHGKRCSRSQKNSRCSGRLGGRSSFIGDPDANFSRRTFRFSRRAEIAEGKPPEKRRQDGGIRMKKAGFDRGLDKPSRLRKLARLIQTVPPSLAAVNSQESNRGFCGPLLSDNGVPLNTHATLFGFLGSPPYA